MWIKLCINKNIKTTYIHRIVGCHFITNPDNKPFINHINGIKSDNRSDNLEWCTQSENHIHAFNNGLQKRGEECSYSVLKEVQVIEVIKRINNNERNCDIAKIMDLSVKAVERIKYNNAWNHIDRSLTFER